ncbi:hypothetical protein A7C99_0936 [Trichophyton rubrum]|uniref:G-protein coupled receptors family 2 profile 2 domain-containing protein n=2 Tax=Trichophyton rubrum TaxID=5551 RepID=A0A178F782_TRIRU|nr:hypothetical protein A7C99_0936 [Trichophyton rubrum]
MSVPIPSGELVPSAGRLTQVANWLAVAAFLANAMLLVSYAVLPLGFIIPLASNPQQCYNEITPNDMFSEMSCAWSGAVVLFGAWTSVTWSFFRTLSLHLQICWNLVLGQRFFLGSLAVGWAIPPMGITIGLVLTGVSYRFGTICHINHDHSIADFWGPILSISGASMLVHLITLLYCMQVYIRSVFEEKPPTNTSSAFPSYTGSVTTLTYRATFKRVKHVIKMQWRGIAVVLVVMTYAIFFTLVFISLDRSVEKTPENIDRAHPWLVCIVLTNGNVKKCLPESQMSLGGPSEGLVLTVLLLLPCCGFWSVLLLGRVSMIPGWVQFFRNKFQPKQEFPPRGITPNKDYAMLSSSSRYNNTKSPDPLLSMSRQSDLSMTTFKVSGAKESVDCTRDEIKYPNPVLSFSRPRPPSAQRAEPNVRDWDPQSTFAPGAAAARTRGYHPSESRCSDRNV